MDPRELKRRFGDRLCFENGVSAQTTLHLGTAEDVQQEVETLIMVLGEGGGYTYGRSVACDPGKDAVPSGEHRGYGSRKGRRLFRSESS